MRLPTLRQLQYFVAVADTLSISQAGELCHVTQPSLSVGLSELEDLLGTPLFERRTRNVQLTPTGTTLLPEAKAILRQSENLVHLTKGGIIAGSMLVFIPAVGEFVIPELLGGPDSLLIGRVLWQECFNNRDWPVAAAVATTMLVLLMVPIMWFHRYQRRELES